MSMVRELICFLIMILSVESLGFGLVAGICFTERFDSGIPPRISVLKVS